MKSLRHERYSFGFAQLPEEEREQWREVVRARGFLTNPRIIDRVAAVLWRRAGGEHRQEAESA